MILSKVKNKKYFKIDGVLYENEKQTECHCQNCKIYKYKIDKECYRGFEYKNKDYKNIYPASVCYIMSKDHKVITDARKILIASIEKNEVFEIEYEKIVDNEKYYYKAKIYSKPEQEATLVTFDFERIRMITEYSGKASLYFQEIKEIKKTDKEVILYTEKGNQVRTNNFKLIEKIEDIRDKNEFK